MALTTFTFVASGSGDGATITIPGTPTAGDLCLIWNYATDDISIPSDVTPAGFTKLVTHTAGGTPKVRASTFAKKLVGGETTVTGLDATGVVRWIAATFTPDSPFATFDLGISGSTGVIEHTDPASQTIESQFDTPVPAVLFAHMAVQDAVTIDPRTISPAMSEIAGFAGNHFAHYKIYADGDTPASHTYDMDDEGDGNSLQGGFLIFTEAGRIMSSLAGGGGLAGPGGIAGAGGGLAG